MTASPPPPWSAMECVYRGRDLADVALVRDLLARDGIPASIKGEHLAGLAGVIPQAETWPTLWVRAHNAARARELVASLEAAGDAPAGPWVCACGEENDANFGSCWQCGRDRPDLLAWLAPESP